MNIGIVGGGAMGCMFAYFLRNAGSLAVYEKSSEAAEALAQGITIRLENTTQKLRLNASANPSAVADSDFILFFVKSYSTKAAAADIKPFVKPTARLISLQNGLGNAEAIRSSLPDNPLLYGTTTIGATKHGLSEVRAGGMGGITLGGDADVFASVEGLFTDAGLSVSFSDKPDAIIWQKAIINAAINPLGAILKTSNGVLAENKYTARLMADITAEAVAAARAVGISVDEQTLYETVLDVCKKTAVNECSMLQDIKNGRQTEIESITGRILSAAEDGGVHAQTNKAVYLLVKAMELRADERRGYDK